MILAAASLSNPLLTDLALTLAAAATLGLVLHRLGQSILPGYLLAGLLVGPGAFGFVDDIESFSALAEVGVALLLFTIGLELPWSKVRKFGGRALSAGGVQLASTVALVTPALALFGVAWDTSFAIASAIALSSTAIVIRVLHDRAETDSVHGLAVMGVLVAQDLAVVVFLVLIPQLGHGEGGSFVVPVLESLAKLALLVGAIWVIERVLMRRIFGRGALARQRELLALLALVTSLGAIAACSELGLSAALGGFLAGMLMAEAEYADQVRGDVAALRMGLVAVFFAWVGMLANVHFLADHATTIAGLTVLLIAGKALLASLSMRVVRIPAMAAILGGVAVAQLGEFSFALLATASDVDLLDATQFQYLISISLVSLLVTPALVGVTSRLLHRRAGARAIDATTLRAAAQPAGQVLVVGAGPSGRAVVDACLDGGYPVSLVELNPRLDAGSSDGLLQLTFGDAANPEVLVRAGVMTARMLVVTIPETTSQRTIIHHARELAPGIHVVARGRYHVYVDELYAAGADEVVDEENVVGIELATAVLDRLLRQVPEHTE